jgi:hypothetical protein
LKVRAQKDAKMDARLDWSFVVWNEDVWNQMFNNPKNTFLSDNPNFRKPVECPKINLYLGGGTVKRDEVVVPKVITVIDHRSKDGGEPVIKGVVREMESGKAMAGVEVTLQPGAQTDGGRLPVAITGDDGAYILKSIPKGGYYVVASKEGYATKRSLTFTELKGADVRAEQFSLSKAVSYSGVVKGPDGEPLEGARIIARNVIGKDGFGYSASGHSETTSDARGAFKLEGLPKGECRINVRLEEFYYPGSVLKKHQLPAPDPVEIRLIGTGTITGTLKKGGKGQNMVSLHPPGGNKVGSWGGSMNCKEDGTFEFKHVPEGEYFIGPHQVEDFKPSDPGAQKIEVKAGKVTTVSLGD